MRQHLLGRTPRLTLYFCGLAVGLSLLVAGIEAARLSVGGGTPGFGWPAVAAGTAGGLVLAFVAGYLNGGLLASWACGLVPTAGRLGVPLAEGTWLDVAVTLVGSAGYGVLLGAAGFVVAVEKHRRDARTADLPAPPSRAAVVGLTVLSGVLGAILVGFGAVL